MLQLNPIALDTRQALRKLRPHRYAIVCGLRTGESNNLKVGIVNRYGVPLGASGVRFKLADYVEAAAKIVPSLASKHVTPHSFRHATAVHLVAAGVDITVIRSWLGHVSLDTTNHYAQANLETKRKALERLENPSEPSKPPSWKHDKRVFLRGSMPFSGERNNVEETIRPLLRSKANRMLLHIMICS